MKTEKLPALFFLHGNEVLYITQTEEQMRPRNAYTDTQIYCTISSVASFKIRRTNVGRV
jgi:hypothetical protein